MRKNKLFKNLFLLTDILLLIISVILLPVDIFCSNVPECLPLIFALSSVTGLLAYLALFKTAFATKILLPVLFALIAVICSVFPYIFPYWNSYLNKNYGGTALNYDEEITFNQAKSDIDYAVGKLAKVHPMFKQGLTDEVKQSRNAALQRLEKADKITVNDLRREIQTILHPIHDAHTSTYNSYPDDRYLKAFPQKNYNNFGVVSINGKNRDKIFEDAEQYYCYETVDWISIDLGSLATLDFLGFDAPYTYEWSDGVNVVKETYEKTDFVSWEQFIEIRNQYVTDDGGDGQEFVSYEIDESKSLAVLTLTECDYNQTYIDCIKSMFTEVKQKNILNVAVDLRGNGGGSSAVGNEFLRYLPVEEYFDGPYDWRWGFFNFHSDGKTVNRQYSDLTFDGKVYILTDNGSFSAAKDFAMLVKDNKLGKTVGEPPANSVNGYGEISYFFLPNTGLYIQISTKKWYRIDKNNTDEYVTPDYPCGGDKAMQTLYGLL